MTNDDILVVTHDLVLRNTGKTVREQTAADLPLPTLDEVLCLPAPEDFWIDIEAKSEPGLTPATERYAQLLSAAVARARERVLVRSFDHAILRAFHPLQPDIPLAALIHHDSDEWVGIARSASASIISPRYPTVTEERVARAHAAGIQVSVWTVNDPEDWTRLSTMGVDAIITDDPAKAVRFFNG